MAKLLTLLILFFNLSGCLPTKPEDLRKTSTPKYTVTVKEEPEKLITFLKDRMQLCHEYPDLVIGHTGSEIEYTQLEDSHFLSFIAGFTYLIDIEIHPIDPHNSEVTIGYFSTWESSAHAVKRWLTDDWKECTADETTIGRDSLVTPKNKITINVEQTYQNVTALISNHLVLCWDSRSFYTPGPHIVDTLINRSGQAFITMKKGTSETSYALAVDIKEESSKSSTVNIYTSPEYLNEVNAIKSLINTGTYSCANGTSDDTLLQDIIRTMPIS